MDIKRVSRGWTMVSLLGIFSLFGCDQQRIEKLEEGVSTEAQVRAQFGEPEKIWDGQGGARILEYNRQPEGATNYMISIGTDGKMNALRQVLTQQNFEKIIPGMMMEDVRKMLGKPAKVSQFALKPGETHWDWRFSTNNQAKMFNVIFNADWRVQSTAITEDTHHDSKR
jgi:outer membrane protein assembly factor BamE (lipoprotein component of BamABCDE complex)